MTRLRGYMMRLLLNRLLRSTMTLSTLTMRLMKYSPTSDEEIDIFCSRISVVAQMLSILGSTLELEKSRLNLMSALISGHATTTNPRSLRSRVQFRKYSEILKSQSDSSATPDQ